MAQVISDRRDVDFVLHEMLHVADLSRHEKYADFNRKTIDMVVTEARNLAVKEILPTQKIGDEEGCRLENGQVTVPGAFRRPYELYCEGEWVAMADDPEYGGQGLPKSVSLACLEYFTGANCALMMYPGLTHGAGKMIEVFGTEKQKKMFLRKMYTGRWAGTMLLTEPEAGSDVGALTTTAVKNDDGTYSITGSKIFISGGDQDLTENIIHPVLARVEGAPAGTRGISLFLVPKIWVNEDGSLGGPNDVTCIGIEEKMGIHGNATASLSLGARGGCRGLLLGEENKGMKYMFMMMNEARMGVGMQGLAFASSSYLNAVSYARERVQGKHLLKATDPDAPSVAIIEHPDVRRQLLSMKAYVDGMRSLLYYVGLCMDKVELLTDGEKRDRYRGVVELLVPVVKAYCTDKAFEVCTQGVQVYGGYGYIREYPQEQLLRDCKITSIYEGTNGIQAMDLLGRKLGMKQGKYFMDLLGEMNKTVAMGKAAGGLDEMAEEVQATINRLGEVAFHIGSTAMSDKVLDAFASAFPFLEVVGDTIMACMHLWRASVAAKALSSTKTKKKDVPFYQGQIKTAEFFVETILPVTLGKMDALSRTSTSVMAMPVDAFTS